MHLQNQAVRPGCNRGQRHGLYQPPIAGRMGRINDNRQMGFLLDNRDDTQVQGVPGIFFKGADAALTKDDLIITARHDIFRRHDPFLNGIGQPAFEQDRLPDGPQSFEQIKVLHIPRTDLD